MNVPSGLLIDLHAQTGRYDIDQLVDTLPWRRTRNKGAGLDRVSELRVMVAAMTKHVAVSALAEETHNATCQAAKDHFERVKKVRRLCSMIAQTETDSLVRHFVKLPDPVEAESIYDVVEDQGLVLRDAVEEAEDSLVELRQLAEQCSVAATKIASLYAHDKAINISRKRSLLHEFIIAMVDVWETCTGKKAPRSAHGPFERLCVAAWNDLGFDPDLAAAIPRAIAERPKLPGPSRN